MYLRYTVLAVLVGLFTNPSIAGTTIPSGDEVIAGTIKNNCPFEVWVRMAVAEQPAARPSEHCQWFQETGDVAISPGGTWTAPIPIIKDTCGTSLKVARYKGAVTPNIYQLEFAWSLEDGKVWYNLSGIDGTPFEDVARTMEMDGTSCQVLHCDAGVPGNDHCDWPILATCDQRGTGTLVGTFC